jgi:phosphoglycolate phosphatase
MYGENLCVGTTLFPGMEALLAELESAGLAWGVVTNKFERFAVPLIAALGLGERAAVVVGGDTCPRPKPFPDPLLHAATSIGIAPMRTL